MSFSDGTRNEHLYGIKGDERQTSSLGTLFILWCDFLMSHYKIQDRSLKILDGCLRADDVDAIIKLEYDKINSLADFKEGVIVDSEHRPAVFDSLYSIIPQDLRFMKFVDDVLSDSLDVDKKVVQFKKWCSKFNLKALLLPKTNNTATAADNLDGSRNEEDEDDVVIDYNSGYESSDGQTYEARTKYKAFKRSIQNMPAEPTVNEDVKIEVITYLYIYNTLIIDS